MEQFHQQVEQLGSTGRRDVAITQSSGGKRGGASREGQAGRNKQGGASREAATTLKAGSSQASTTSFAPRAGPTLSMSSNSIFALRDPTQ